MIIREIKIIVPASNCWGNKCPGHVIRDSYHRCVIFSQQLRTQGLSYEVIPCDECIRATIQEDHS